MAKRQKTSAGSIEKTLTLAGVALVVLGSVASLYYTYVNRAFVHDPIPDLIYYLNYLVVLGGGFAGGYLLISKKGTASQSARLFNGAVYSSIAMALYSITDLLRFFLRDTFKLLPMQVDYTLFQYTPLIALAITLAIAFVLQARTKKSELSPAAKWLLIITFLAAQAYYLASTIYYTVLPQSGVDQFASPLWLTILSYLTNPVLICVVAYLVLRNVKPTSQRLFYATFIASLLYILILVMWNFRPDPTADATNVFQGVASIIIVLVSIGLLWKVRKAKY